MLDITTLRSKLAEVSKTIEEASITGQHSSALIEATQEYNRLHHIVETYEELQKLKSELNSLNEITDADLVELVAGEHSLLSGRITELSQELTQLTLRELPHDEKACIIEVRAGTGGTEAAIFAEELLRMYQKYCVSQHWQIEITDITPDSEAGIKNAIISVNSKGSYRILRFESGVHRVQRVPATEAAGRIHTSTASIAILPQIDDINVVIDERELRIDVYRSSGPGGQSVNTTDSAVRITHLPTKIIVTCQESKSQLKNKEKALKVLAAKLYAAKEAELNASLSAERREQIQGGDRSAKIRTYNFPQSRVTDHRLKQSWHNINEIIDGYLDDIIKAEQLFMRSAD